MKKSKLLLIGCFLSVGLPTLTGCAVVEDIGTIVERAGEAVKNTARARQEKDKNSGGKASGTNTNTANKGNETNSQHERVSEQSNASNGNNPVFDPKLKEAQQLLARLGYSPVSVDGLMGGETRSALNEFQREYGLAVTYSLNDETYSKLQQAAKNGTSTNPQKGSGNISDKKVEEDDTSTSGALNQSKEKPQIEKNGASSSNESTESGDQKRLASVLEDVELKAAANVFSSNIRSIPRGTRVTVIEVEGDWVKVLFKDNTGYVYTDLIQYVR